MSIISIFTNGLCLSLKITVRNTGNSFVAKVTQARHSFQHALYSKKKINTYSRFTNP